MRRRTASRRRCGFRPDLEVLVEFVDEDGDGHLNLSEFLGVILPPGLRRRMP